MFSTRGKFISFTLLLLSLVNIVFAQNKSDAKEKEAIEDGIKILKNYFLEDNNWHVVQPEVGNNVNGLIHFIEDRHIDAILDDINKTRSTTGNYVLRLPENVEDSLSVSGYISAQELQQNIIKLESDYKSEVKIHEIMVPASVLTEAESKAKIIPEGKGIQLFTDSIYSFPDSLIIPEVIPDSVLNSPEQFNRLIQIDSFRKNFIEEKRQAYNDSIKIVYVNAVARQYRQDRYDEGLSFRKKRYKDLVRLSNYQILEDYNNQVVGQVNDSIDAVLQKLTAYADLMDTTRVNFVNLEGQRSSILLQNGNERFSRVWLKNEQNDSLGITLKNLDKNSVQMLMDDGVMFSRFKEKETKTFDFGSLKTTSRKFNGVSDRYEVETPWTFGGDGSLGFTQTNLENWQSGGESSLASLLVLKGTANYTRKDGNLKWENTLEIQNGWIKTGKADSLLQKNNDKFELTSRLGLSAFKKWYYSAELNFSTQLFNGYDYPKSDGDAPISAFMAPAKTYLKFGLDYKPNTNFSLLLSPLTIKNTFVGDTAKVDQTTYGVDEDRKSYWEPGLNVDLTYKRNIIPDLSYTTKYSMFVNYKFPFSSFDVDWENTFKYQANNHIAIQLILHFVYDDNVLFSVYDDDGEEIGEEKRLQIKEYFSIGFTYNINKDVRRIHRLR
jgi:hypothetical protein